MIYIKKSYSKLKNLNRKAKVVNIGLLTVVPLKFSSIFQHEFWKKLQYESYLIDPNHGFGIQNLQNLKKHYAFKDMVSLNLTSRSKKKISKTQVAVGLNE